MKASCLFAPKEIVMSCIKWAEIPSPHDLINSIPRLNYFDKQAIDEQWRAIQWHQFSLEFQSDCNAAKFFWYIMPIEEINSCFKSEMFKINLVKT